MTAPSLLIAGCGDIGSRLATRLLPHGWTVHGLRRTVSELPAGVHGVAGDLFKTPKPAQWPDAALDYVVYCATPRSVTKRVTGWLTSRACVMC